jgi:hypothetical protein
MIKILLELPKDTSCRGNCDSCKINAIGCMHNLLNECTRKEVVPTSVSEEDILQLKKHGFKVYRKD